MPSFPHAEADGAYRAFRDFPTQAHVVHPTVGQRPSLPTLDDGGCRCPCTVGPHPDIHGDTDHRVRGLEREGEMEGWRVKAGVSDLCRDALW